MSTATRGRSYEHRVRNELRDHGYTVVRAAGSKGIVDLVGFHRDDTLLIQVKGVAGGLYPEAWNALYDLADLCGGVPLLAEVLPRKPIAYWRLTARKEKRGPQPYEPYILGCAS